MLELAGSSSRSGLRFHVAGRRRMALRQGDRWVLLGRVEDDHCGVEIFRTGDFRSPVPALTAARAHRFGPQSTAGWWERWAHGFAGDLVLSEGPWLLQRGALPRYGLTEDLVREFPAAYLDWLAGWNGTVPLLPLPEASSGRVKAYRKLARDRMLPPVLLLAASALDGYLVLDGHARIVAAQLEGIDPPVLVLSPRLSWRERQAATEPAAARLEEARLKASRLETAGLEAAGGLEMAGGMEAALAAASRLEVAALTRSVIDLGEHLERASGRNRAWSLPGGVAAWRAIAARVAPGWPAG